MTRIESVVVEGFKRIDRLRFDSGTLNVITGRNNSGKTSLLEAIDLAVHPTHIANFGENLDTLINHHHDESRIEIETDDGTRELQLVTPDKMLIPELLLEAFRTGIHSTWDPPIEESKFEEEVEEITRSYLSESLSSTQLAAAGDETIILRINGTEYPYVYFGPVVSDLYLELNTKVGEKIGERPTEFGESPATQTTFSELTTYRHLTQKGHFVSEEPFAIGGLTHVDFMQLSETFELSADDADPVKVDNVGDFLREKEIVENLKTFGLDDLVFESEDGEKYSVPFEFMGEGFKTTVGVVWELLDEDGPDDIVLLEEPGTHMHPGYVRELIYFLVEVARTDDTQLFVTTHNNDVLNDFFTENLRSEEVAFLEEEFRLLQLQDGGADSMDYREAENQLKELKLDLRGL